MVSKPFLRLKEPKGRGEETIVEAFTVKVRKKGNNSLTAWAHLVNR